MGTKTSLSSPPTPKLILVVCSSNEINWKVVPLKDVMMFENVSTNIIIGIATQTKGSD